MTISMTLKPSLVSERQVNLRQLLTQFSGILACPNCPKVANIAVLMKLLQNDKSVGDLLTAMAEQPFSAMDISITSVCRHEVLLLACRGYVCMLAQPIKTGEEHAMGSTGVDTQNRARSISSSPLCVARPKATFRFTSEHCQVACRGLLAAKHTCHISACSC